MPQVRVAGRPVQDRHVVKLAEGRVEAARAQAQRNNVDDVFIKVGQDVWVASRFAFSDTCCKEPTGSNRNKRGPNRKSLYFADKAWSSV